MSEGLKYWAGYYCKQAYRIWKQYWLLYFCMTVIATVIFLIYICIISPDLYESNAVLYSSKYELLDDAAVFMKGKNMQQKAAEQVGYSWEEFRDNLIVTTDEDNGKIELIFRSACPKMAFECAKASEKVFLENVSELIGLDDITEIMPPAMPDNTVSIPGFLICIITYMFVIGGTTCLVVFLEKKNLNK